jgi:hypothetical protein
MRAAGLIDAAIEGRINATGGCRSGGALIWFNGRNLNVRHGSAMKISDFTCVSCGSSYQVAESISVPGSPGRAECSVCGALLEAWQEPRMKAYRLVLAPELKYPRVAVPPSPSYPRSA